MKQLQRERAPNELKVKREERGDECQRPWMNESSGVVLRARPLTLHLHLHLDAGKCPIQPGITQMWMKKFPGGVELPIFPRFMQGACYQLKTNNFRKVLEIIG